MNIYEPEGTDAIVDLRAASRELRAVGSITGESQRKAAVAEITAATLLDIALSLRVVAAEARAAMPSPVTGDDVEPEPEEAGDLLVVGDLVAVDGYAEPGEVRAFGQSEGSITVDVAFADGAESRVWLEAVTRLVGDERDDDSIQDAAEASIAATAADPEAGTPNPEPADLVDDIDDDFEGDTHTAAATALDVLRENEAARKAAKKSGKKGSKK